MPVGPAKFDVNRCNESPLRSEKPDFWPVSKFNTGSLPLRSILPVTICISYIHFYSSKTDRTRTIQIKCNQNTLLVAKVGAGLT